MSQKKKFEELIVNIKKWHEINGNEELQAYLDALEAEVTALVEPTTMAFGDPGGNNPPAPKVP